MTLRTFIEDILDRILNAIRALHIEITNITFTGSIVSFVSKYAGLPLKSHKIALTATQSGSGTPSPDNVRPISGHDVIIISHSGADISTPTTHTITIGSTVYGGEYDARTGVLTITHGIVDLGTLTWIETTSFGGSNRALLPDNSGLTSIPCYCDSLKVVTSGSELIEDCIYPYKNGTGVYTKNDPSTLSDISLVYGLDTPIEIQLPPCPIDTLQGENNIWADTGDTTIVTIDPKIKGGN